jgi:hypothetical protein
MQNLIIESKRTNKLKDVSEIPEIDKFYLNYSLLDLGSSADLVSSWESNPVAVSPKGGKL